jgi:hypothetical protein
MPKIKPLKGDQLPLDELLSEAKTIAQKPIQKPYKISPFYRGKNRGMPDLVQCQGAIGEELAATKAAN